MIAGTAQIETTRTERIPSGWRVIRDASDHASQPTYDELRRIREFYSVPHWPAVARFLSQNARVRRILFDAIDVIPVFFQDVSAATIYQREDAHGEVEYLAARIKSDRDISRLLQERSQFDTGWWSKKFPSVRHQLIFDVE
ncbi:hypothetical protein BH24CHL4_BH24CHL4_20180 [soil metagenome]